MYEGPDAEKDFEIEVDGFKKLTQAASDSNVIRYYGFFTHRGTKNILLEYANKGTLEEYWECTRPPTKGTEIVKLWERIFGLFAAVMAIHGVEWTDSELPQIFQGYFPSLLGSMQNCC